MNAPTKLLDQLILQRRIRHGGHPVLSWCARNVTLEKDAPDNWKPSKALSRERIDGIVGTVMGLARACLHDPSDTSVDSYISVMG